MKCDRVIPHLFIGVAPLTDDDFQQLKALNVTAILSLQTEEDGQEAAIERERSAAVKAGIGFTNLPVTDFDRLELLWKLPKAWPRWSESWQPGTLYSCIAQRA